MMKVESVKACFVCAVRVSAVFVTTMAALVVGTACSDGESLHGAETVDVRKASQALSASTQEVTIALPGGLRPRDVAVGATQALRVAEAAEVRGVNGALANLVNTGNEDTYLGVDSDIGNVWSQATVSLANRAKVQGFLRTAGTAEQQQDSEVVGPLQEQVPTTPLKEANWEVELPTSGPPVSLEPGEGSADDLVPGTYGYGAIKSGATLNVQSGTYFFDGLTFEPDSRLIIDDEDAPVIFYVRDGFTWRGKLERKGDPAASKLKFLVVALGGNSMPIERAFRGTVVAPNGSLLLHALNGEGEHWGAFFGRSVNVEAGVVINHHRFPWSGLLPVDPVTLNDADTLAATTDPSGSSVVETTLGTPVEFEVPDDVWVTRGNAGNGTLTISFRAPGQATQTCTYQGGSPVAHPLTDLDRAKGRRYLFPTCTGDVQPGSTYLVDWVGVEIVSSDPEAVATSVSVPVGPGCHDSLPAPMNPEEVVAVRDNFDWRTVDRLPDVDPEGNPALWHAMIYIDRREQLTALDQWRVRYSAIPWAQSYIEQLSGKCGRVEHATDGKGVVVYAILPARLFNLLRSFAIEAVLDGGIEPPFKFIVPSSPEGEQYANADGSIKYSALGTSGYADWLASLPPQQPGFGDFVNKVTKPLKDAGEWVDDNIIDPIVNPISEAAQEGFSYSAHGWDQTVDWLTNHLDDVWEEVQQGLASFLDIFSTRVDVTLDFTILNRDPSLAPGSSMIRVWGNRMAPVDPMNPAAGIQPTHELVPTDSMVRIRQWGWGFLPVMGENELPEHGRVAVKVLRDDDGRGNSALCVELDNDAAMMTTDFIPNEVCDFDGMGFDDIPTGTDVNPIPVNTNQKELHAMTQLVDSADYSRQVINFDPHKADVLIGWIPNELTGIITNAPNLGGSNERAMTLCLDFPGVGSGLVQGLTGGEINPLLNKDIWWPDEKDARGSTLSRGVMTHEYGHFLMCSLAVSHQHGNALTAVIERPLLERTDDSREDTITIATEAFADLFTLQVVGGTNYTIGQGAFPGGGVNFCRPGGSCLEFNYRGIEDLVDLRFRDPSTGTNEEEAYAFHDELAKFTAIAHDVFDRADSSARGTLAAWNGDVWQDVGGGTNAVEFAPNGYLAFDDENVALPASMFYQWVEHWFNQPGADIVSWMIGLNNAMEEAAPPVNWCDRCELFALHDSASVPLGVSGNPAMDRAVAPADRWRRWELCQNSDRLTHVLGPPPEPFLNINPVSCQECGPLEFLNPGTGMCTPCGTGEVPRGDHCEPCDPGTVPGPGNLCTGCGLHAISVGGQCVPCREGEGANPATNTCAECWANLVVDWNDVPEQECFEEVRATVPAYPPQVGICPDQFWVEVINLPEAVARGGESLAITAQPSDEPSSAAACTDSSVLLTQHRFSNTATDLWQHVGTTQMTGNWNSPSGGPAGVCSWPQMTQTVSAAEIQAGTDRLRFRAEAYDGLQIVDAQIQITSAHGGIGCNPI